MSEATEVAEVLALARSLFTADARMREAAARTGNAPLEKAAGPAPAKNDPRLGDPCAPRREIPADVEAAIGALGVLGCAAALSRRTTIVDKGENCASRGNTAIERFLEPMVERAASVLELVREHPEALR